MSPTATPILETAKAMFPKSSPRIRIEAAFRPGDVTGEDARIDGWTSDSSVHGFATRANVESLRDRGFTEVTLHGSGAKPMQDTSIARLLGA